MKSLRYYNDWFGELRHPIVRHNAFADTARDGITALRVKLYFLNRFAY